MKVSVKIQGTWEDVNTQQGCIHFIKSVDSGKLYVQADAVHKGSKTAIHHVVITTPEGKTVADATFTMFLFDPI